jgi:hypothetical protein
VRPNLFNNVKVAHRALIRVEKPITAKWNSSSAPAFTIDAGVPFEEWRLEITDIVVTLTESTPIRVYLT